jgi:hypothetical protein
MRIRTAATAVLLLATLLGCGSRADTADSKPKPAPSPTPTRVYDVHDCRALLERQYDNDALRDFNSDPECAHLTHDGYLDVVKTVLTGRKDQILDEAADHVMWDEAWDGTDRKQQQLVCDRARDEGAVAIGQEMIDAAADPDEEGGNPIDMVQYFLDEKC